MLPEGEIDIGASLELGASDFTTEKLIENVYVVYGIGRFYDIQRDKYLSKLDIQNAAGEVVCKEYINSPDKKIIYPENIVFDPRVKETRPGIINTYKGLTVKPKESDCSVIIESIKYLCGNDEKLFHHVICWLAYALQNPGAKMAHALVFMGCGGSGKNLTFNVMLRIYGEYSTIISQDQLGSQFNGFMRRRLFIVVNEAVSRKHLFEYEGKLKNLITESIININEKNQPLVQERNNVNLIFFSNTYTPVVADSDDRRFVVIHTPPKKDKKFYSRLAKQINNGGAQGFLYFLLNYNLGDFNEYTEPVMTKAKEDLIELSMKSDERFIINWVGKKLFISSMPCKGDDLYSAYRKWCKREGEKFAVSKIEFCIRLGKHPGILKQNHKRYINSKKAKYMKGTFYYPFDAEKPEDKADDQWLTDCHELFWQEFDDWKEQYEA
jgi:putative DNA primase/helicase